MELRDKTVPNLSIKLITNIDEYNKFSPSVKVWIDLCEHGKYLQ